MDLDYVVVDLQTRIAFQEESIEQLNHTLALQQTRIARLTEEMARLRELLNELKLSPVRGAHDESPPPHY